MKVRMEKRHPTLNTHEKNATLLFIRVLHGEIEGEYPTIFEQYELAETYTPYFTLHSFRHIFV